MTGGPEKNPKAFLATDLAILPALTAIEIAVFRRLNLIAEKGTAILSTLLAVGVVVNLTLLIYPFSSQPQQ